MASMVRDLSTIMIGGGGRLKCLKTVNKILLIPLLKAKLFCDLSHRAKKVCTHHVWLP